MCEDWEKAKLSHDLLTYAARDVFASQLIFEKATKTSPISRPQFDSPAGIRVALLAQEGGDPIAYGTIASAQPASLGNIRVKTPNRNRLVLDIDTMINPSAAVMLHLPPSSMTAPRKGRTKSGALTLEQLRVLSIESGPATAASSVFKVVSPLLSIILTDANK
jgi:hypothetical protein